jgi:hypothetical protein
MRRCLALPFTVPDMNRVRPEGVVRGLIESFDRTGIGTIYPPYQTGSLPKDRLSASLRAISVRPQAITFARTIKQLNAYERAYKRPGYGHNGKRESVCPSVSSRVMRPFEAAAPLFSVQASFRV